MGKQKNWTIVTATFIFIASTKMRKVHERWGSKHAGKFSTSTSNNTKTNSMFFKSSENLKEKVPSKERFLMDVY